MRHFYRGVKITRSNPAVGILVIPINGVSTLFPGGKLPLDKFCFVDDEPILSGKDIDVAFVAF